MVAQPHRGGRGKAIVGQVDSPDYACQRVGEQNDAGAEQTRAVETGGLIEGQDPVGFTGAPGTQPRISNRSRVAWSTVLT